MGWLNLMSEHDLILIQILCILPLNQFEYHRMHHTMQSLDLHLYSCTERQIRTALTRLDKSFYREDKVSKVKVFLIVRYVAGQFIKL